MITTALQKSWKSGAVSSLTLFFSFNTEIPIMDLLPYHLNFRNSFISTKLFAGILIGIELNLKIKLKRTTR